MRAIEWVDDHVDVVDQTVLPARRRVALRSVGDVVGALERLVVRGAPMVGVLGALGVALSARDRAVLGEDDAAVVADAERIVAASPSAGNLERGVRRVLPLVPYGPDAVLRGAQLLLDDESRACATLARLGAVVLRSYVDGPMVLLTHCTGGGPTGGAWGTATGVVRALHRDALVRSVVVGEARPLLRGSRITATALAEAGVPHSVVVDAAAPGLVARGLVDAVVVGADRVTATFDVVHEVGTLGLALAAARAGVPFVVTATESTIDPTTRDAAAAPLEDRDPDEVLLVGGWRMTPAASHGLNPACDVTPADLVTAIVTESRVLEPASRRSSAAAPPAAPAAAPVPDPLPDPEPGRERIVVVGGRSLAAGSMTR